MQDHSDDEADDIHAMLDPQEQPQQAEQVPVPIVAAVVVPPAPVAQPVQEELMQISAAAYAGLPSESTISLRLSLKGCKATALADTGSTNTFMDKSFAVKNNIKMTAIQPQTVTVAGGGELSSSAVASNCNFKIHGMNFCADFRILDLQGADIILGVNWFKKYNPVTFEFVART
jgi:hypothetical protein